LSDVSKQRRSNDPRQTGSGHAANDEKFGRYRLRGVLGQGGMGRLDLAEQRGIQGFVKVVVLKRILPHLAESDQFREMFLHEARIAARLEHPNIVATYELGEVEGKYFISMEYLPGEDLAAVLARCPPGRPMPIEIAVALAQQGACGLDYAHEARDSEGRPIGLVHRDVNPRNIFVTYHGVVKLLDFGVVRGQGGQKTLPGVFKGKYAYCAPEQIEGGPIDRRTDVFSLGIVLWECLTGLRLFDGGTEARTIDAVRSRPIDPPSAVRPEVPRELDAIVLKALARDRDQRFRSAQEMSEALERFLLDREQWPTAKSFGQWLESLFGAERASLKEAIARGSAVETTLARLRELGAVKSRPGESSPGGSVGGWSNLQPRTLWSTSLTGEGSMGGDGGRGTPSQSHAPYDQQAAHGSSYPSRKTPSFDSLSPVPLSEPRSPRTGGSIRTGHSVRVVVKKSLAARLKLPAIAVGGIAVLAVVAVVGSPPGSGPGRDGARSSAPPAIGEPTRAEPSAARTTTAPPAPGATAAPVGTGSLEVRSEPPGAHVFVDGDPSGMRTPAVLTGLRIGRTLEIRLDLGGYLPARQQAEIQGVGTRTLSVLLKEATGMLRLEGLPRRATVYIDDAPIEVHGPVSVPVGTHRLRVETMDDVLLNRTIDVAPGEQTIPVRAGREP
jgi:serine/threonine protein kinase